MSTPDEMPDDTHDAHGEIRDEADDRPSSVRVERFLHVIDDRRKTAARTRWLALAVGGVVAAVVYLTAAGVVPVEAENLVLSAGVVVAGLALSKG